MLKMGKALTRRLRRAVFRGCLRAEQSYPADAELCRMIEGFRPFATIELSNGELRLACPNFQAWWRAATFFDKEPETLGWIQGFGPGETMLDVGANVGLYSLYAAHRGHRVLALEPESQNFALMNENIHLNGLVSRVTAYCLALSNR